MTSYQCLKDSGIMTVMGASNLILENPNPRKLEGQSV
jgi:hypothetical protein